MTRVCTGNHESPVGNRPDSHVRYLAVVALLLWPAVSAADLVNPGLEQSFSVLPYPDSVPLYWRLANADHTVFGAQVTYAWKTEGSRSAGLFSRFGRSFTAGSYQSIYQWTDLTGMAGIAFDVRLAAYGSSTITKFDKFQASLLVDGMPLWTQTVDGTYLDQQVNIPVLAGLHPVELRITARTAGQFPVANWVQWDNLRLVKVPEETIIDAIVDVDPNAVNLNSQGAWITCYIELPGYDVNDIDGQTVTLEGVNAYMGRQDWACAQANAANTVDHDGDGVMERMVKFDRSAVQATLHRGTVTVTVMGKLPNHTTLRGTDLIKVIGGGGQN